MLALLLGSAFMLTSAEVFMHVQFMEPCLLCVSQQLAFFAVGLVAAVALVVKRRRLAFPVLTGIFSTGGGAVAIRQLWLQSLPEGEVPACGANFEYLVDVLPLSELIAAMLSGTGECAEVDWAFLGLSMAGWALVAFLTFLAISILSLRTSRS